MNYIVFDLEWNAAPSEKEAVKEPCALAGEIIEIGAVKLNDNFETVDETRIFVSPKYYTHMDSQIAALTKINNSRLKKEGLPFPEAYKTFTDWCGDGYSFMTWSESDMLAMIENMLVWGMDVSEFPMCYDIQRIFGREIMRDDRQCSLDKAIEILGESGDRAHDALHDARNTVKVCNHLDLDLYLDEYGSRLFAEPPVRKVFESLDEILHDEELATFTCPWCGKKGTVEGWLMGRRHNCSGYGICDDEDEFMLCLNVNKCEDGFRVNRVLYDMSDDLWDQYQDRLEHHNLIPVEPAAV